MKKVKDYLIIVLLITLIGSVVYLNPYAKDTECCENADKVPKPTPCRVYMKICNETPDCKVEELSCDELQKQYEELKNSCTEKLNQCKK